MSVSKKPMVLVILDGYGYREDQQDNAIYSAKTPVMDALWAKRPHTLIDASGLEVGLPDRQMGNSEVGHVNLGAGRIVYQDLTRLDVEIKERTFFANPVLTAAVDKAVAAGKAVHIMGLMSPGGVHSHEDHIMAMVELAAERGAEKIYLHAFLDGRDTPPRSAEKTLATFEAKFAALGKGRIASLIGRYYAMDRDNRWDRVEQAYDLLTLAKGEFQADTAVAGLQAAYARDENDEFVKATVIRAAGQADAAMEDGDALIFMNFRADRAREITRAFVNADFDGFARKKVVNLDFVMLTEYAADIKVACAYPPASLANTFGEWMAKHDKTQLRINKNLRNRRPSAALDHLLTLRGIAIDRQLMERYAFAVQQRFRADAERAGRFGVDLNIGHDFTPVVTLRVLRRSLCSLHVRREEKTRRHHHAR